MKKIALSLTFVAAVLCAPRAFAQTSDGDSRNFRLGIGGSIGAVTNDGYSVALGADLKVQKDFTSNISGTLSGGYTNFSFDGKNTGSIGFIPLKAGVKIFPREFFYVTGEVGAGFGTDEGQKTAFVWAPGVGMGLNNGIDLGLRYEGFSRSGSTLSQVALRVAYGFNLSR